jgi:hypothetical protein
MRKMPLMVMREESSSVPKRERVRRIADLPASHVGAFICRIFVNRFCDRASAVSIRKPALFIVWFFFLVVG